MQQESQQEPLWTKSFLSITVCSFLLFLNLQMLLSSFPAYVQNDLHAGNVAVSLVTSVFALTSIAARFMTAAFMKRVSKDYLLMAGLLLAAITTLLYPFAHTVGSLLIMRIGYGVGFGMASTILPTLVSQLIPARRMGEGIGYFGLSTSLAMSIGPMIGMNVMSGFGFGTLASVGTAVVLLILPILLLSGIVRIKGGVHQASLNAAAVSGVAGKTGFNHKLWMPAVLNMMLSITYSGLLSFIVLFGEFAGLKQVGMFFLFNAITIVIIRPISGRLFDRKGPATVLIPAGLFVAASMLLLSYTHTMSMLIIAALLYGLGFGAIQPTLQAWMLRTSSKEQYGAANSMFYNSTDFGVAVGALLLGAIATMTDYASMYRYSAGVMVLFVVLFLIIYASTRTSMLRNNQTSL
ncbi:MFS transporter [Paenibacillus sp. NPDC057967]|uniref:MFS transporter n=1 Tax=Paenibacillus sp. NPDC057967 TaxID=3346293 RepID=UPI0036DA3106